VLLMGCSHGENTTLHLAEILAGVPYRVPRHCTVIENGQATRIDYGENDHCCRRFALADAWLRLRGLQSEGHVGHAHARLARSRDIVAVAREHLASDPLVFLCAPDTDCTECRDVHSGADSWERLRR